MIYQQKSILSQSIFEIRIFKIYWFYRYDTIKINFRSLKRILDFFFVSRKVITADFAVSFFMFAAIEDRQRRGKKWQRKKEEKRESESQEGEKGRMEGTKPRFDLPTVSFVVARCNTNG